MAASKKTPEAVERARAMAASGTTHREIAEALGVSRPTVGRWTRGIPRRRRGAKFKTTRADAIRTPEKIERARAMWEQGMTQLEIGKVFGVGQTSISGWLRTSRQHKKNPESVAQAQAMAEAGLTQTQIAKHFGVEQATISSWLRGSAATKNNATRVTRLSLYPENLQGRARDWLATRKRLMSAERELDRALVDACGGLPNRDRR